ncbi:MAG TPA: hypothetical protein VFL07_17890 [Rudaea sp.]|nr:hypothetical protein [Rudaea sp.]
MAITISVVRETMSGERRVALTPDVAKKLKAKGASLLIERGAGDAASFPDAAYKDTEVAGDARSALARADVLPLRERHRLTPVQLYDGSDGARFTE